MRFLRWGRTWTGHSALLALSSALLLSACGSEDDLRGPTPLFDEVPIEYPLSLWDEGVEGTTVIRVRVTETGVVDSTLVLESSGHDAFDSAALRGGRRLRFEPATRDGERTAVWAHVPVRFSLDGEEAAEALSRSNPSPDAPSSPDADGVDEAGGAEESEAAGSEP